MNVSDWAYPQKQGLYIAPLDAYIDPVQPVARALITHGHADHARAGHGHVFATPQTLDIMARRYGDDFATKTTSMDYGKTKELGDCQLCFISAGHVLGSAQICITHEGKTLIAAGDYKRKYDPTVIPFEVRSC